MIRHFDGKQQSLDDLLASDEDTDDESHHTARDHLTDDEVASPRRSAPRTVEKPARATAGVGVAAPRDKLLDLLDDVSEVEASPAPPVGDAAGGGGDADGKAALARGARVVFFSARRRRLASRRRLVARRSLASRRRRGRA